MKFKQEKQFQIQQEAIKREAVKKQLQSHQQLQGKWKHKLNYKLLKES